MAAPAPPFVKSLFVKICCIASPVEAQAAIAAGASAVGLVSAMPSGPGVVDETRIAEIASTVPAHVETFLLTALTSAADIARQHDRCRTTTIQLVDHVEPAELVALRRRRPRVRLVQVIHVTGRSAVEEALAVEDFVDALLLDSGNPGLAVKELGGTGRTHDWRISREIRERVECPVVLAGGLDAENVGAALDAVAPAGLDLCSGVRTGGRLDHHKLAAFFAAVQGATA